MSQSVSLSLPSPENQIVINEVLLPLETPCDTYANILNIINISTCIGHEAILV